MNKLNTIIIALLISTAFVRAGSPVSCGSGINCNLCGDTDEIRRNFAAVSQTECSYSKCNQATPINGFICQSCYGQSDAVQALNQGGFYNPTTNSCVISCPYGTQPDYTTSTCHSVKPGNNVACSTAVDCSKCGATQQIQNLFTPVSETDCQMIDCSQTPPSYNGYVCKSCYQVSGAAAALNIGNFYDPGTSACVASCPQGTQADNTNTCQIVKPGKSVICGYSGSCSRCGDTPQIANLFKPVNNSKCKMIDCSQTPPSYNGYVCKSCFQATGATDALNIGYFYDPGTSACVASCPQGNQIDFNNKCKPIPTKPGNNISCGSGGSCSGCGATSQIVNLFTTVSQSSCKMIDCSQTPPSYNAYVCQSCYQAAGAIAALNIGNYYNPGTHACVTSCPQGTQADNTNTCQPIPTKPGNNISCGLNGSCSGCGTTPQIVNLFTPISGSNCKVTDCSQTPTSYSSYVCQSCYQVTGAIAALNIGNYYDPGTNACVAECPQGKVADIKKNCQIPQTIIGKDVSCGTVASNGNAANCNLCGDNSIVQNLFSYDTTTAGQNCQFKDCSTIPSTLNGWICNSCNGVEGSKIPVGLYFDGSTCVSTCSTGVATSQSNWTFNFYSFGILRKYYNHGKKRKRVKSKIYTIDNFRERTGTRIAIHLIDNYFKSKHS
ncbi:immobilization antigen (macronuclear) [Tetrahymena thermophila SB210]|uniref:Immobilization antigen n=1 Tax=Tetrahymena thermophila (strain SB210) TaxID=312017 RepID=Q23J45_TETTS|nr:immobilization antigen [Tetrahymena thermophila SB210]EAR96659.2 immobilization antigen [Tetrahymena thermophila SB210]|eukprot:XP_001016904.2 immobilization antigen [Tetrahymena thermophila SB210]